MSETSEEETFWSKTKVLPSWAVFGTLLSEPSNSDSGMSVAVTVQTSSPEELWDYLYVTWAPTGIAEVSEESGEQPDPVR